MLASGSTAFFRLLNIDFSDMSARSSSESSVVSSTFGDNSANDFNEDTEYLIRSDPSKQPPLRLVKSITNSSLTNNSEFISISPSQNVGTIETEI